MANIIRPILVLSASISGFWAISKALIFPSYESLLTKYIFPLLCVSCLFLIPTTSIRIEDVIKNKSYKVDHVPFLLARSSELISSIGYKVTKSIESIMHVPNDTSYNLTGMVFGADTALDTTKYQLTNATLEQNLRRFSKQCVLYDIALERYSIDDLKKSSDLWKLFEEKTSNVRMMNYCDEKCTYVSCKEAIQKMKPLFEKEKNYHAGLDILGSLPLTFQALTGLKKDREELIGQQLTMNLLSNEYNRFTKARASTQNQSTLRLVGWVASSSLLSIRNVFEAIIYIGFIFVLPLSLVPGGLKIIKNWVCLLVWIQMWPPLYAILSYIIQITAQSHAIFAGLAADQLGLSFFTNTALQNLQDNMIGATNFLFSSVPVMSYMFLKGGIHAFSNMASSVMSPMQNAASSAAAEESTGNYSFANTSFGQMSYQNTNGFQSNLAPSISDGFFTDHQGISTKIYSADENQLQQNSSRLRVGMSLNESDNQTIQRCEQEAQSLVESNQKTFLENLSSHSKMTADLSSHFANSKNYSEGISTKEGHGLQESLSYIQNVAENWGKQYGLNSRESLEALVNASFGGIFGNCLSATVGGGYSFNTLREDMLNSALAVTKSAGFQSNLQKVNDIAASQNFNEIQDEGSRFMEAYGASLDTLKSSQSLHQVALTKQKQISDNVAWLSQNSSNINQSLDQDFINWAQKEYGGLTQVDELLSKSSPEERQNILMNFMEKFKPSNITSTDLSSDYQRQELPKIDEQAEKAHISNFLATHLENYPDLLKWDINNQKEILNSSQHSYQNNYDKGRQDASDQIGNKQDETAKQLDDKNESFLISRILSYWYTPESISKKYQVIDKPFWMEE